MADDTGEGRDRTSKNTSQAVDCGVLRTCQKPSHGCGAPWGPGGIPWEPPSPLQGAPGGEESPQPWKRFDAEKCAREKEADHVDGYDRDDLGESTDY